MTTQISIHVAVLAAVLNAAAKKDVRSYLNGVRLEPKSGHCRTIATDGRMLVVGTDAGSKWAGDETPITLPRDTIAWAIKNSRSGQRVYVRVDGDKVEVVSGDGSTKVAAPLGGTYPDWQRVLPFGSLSGEEPVLECGVVAQLSKIGTDLKKYGASRTKFGTGLVVVGNGLHRAAAYRMVDLIDGINVGGVVMPFKAEVGFGRDDVFADFTR